MSRRSKIRFVIDVGGEYRELFWALNRPNGDVGMGFRASDNYGPVNPEETSTIQPIRDSVVSVHRCLQSEKAGTLIKSTLNMKAGGIRTNAAFIKYSRNNILWQIISAVAPDMRHPRYAFHRRESDRVIVLGREIPRNSSLVFHVFICGQAILPPDIMWCTKHVVDMRFFKICVYVNYSRIWQGLNSMFAQSVTSVPQRDGAEVRGISVPEEIRHGAVSLKDKEVEPLLFSLNEQIMVGMTIKMLDDMQASDELRREMMDVPMLFSRYPEMINPPLI